MRTFDSNEFSWQAGEGFAFASDLGFPVALPAQFSVRSRRTGVVKSFHRTFPVYSSGPDAELTGVMYCSDDVLFIQIGND